MHIIEDTRQKIGKHDLKIKQMEDMENNIVRCKLPVGDYAPFPPISIDTKQDLNELYTDVVSQHVRFRNECILAQENDCKLIILIEDDDVHSLEEVKDWKSKIRGTAVFGDRLYKTLCTMNKKYGVVFEFCDKNETGKRIIEILSKKAI